MAKLSWILQNCSFLGQCCGQTEFCFPCHVRACCYIPPAHCSMSPTDTPTWLHISSRQQTQLPCDLVDHFTISIRNEDTSLPFTSVPQIFSIRWTQEGGAKEGDLSWTQMWGQMMWTGKSRRWDRDNSKKELKDAVRATKNKFNIDESHYPWAAQQTTENHTDPSRTWLIITWYYDWKVNITKY